MKEKKESIEEEFNEDNSEEGDSEEEFGESSSSDARKMYKVTCSECGKECEVPFEPEKDRKVYCNECYKKMRPPRRSFNNRRGGFGGGRNFGGNNRGDRGGFRRMHKATCTACKSECEVPFKPIEGREILCNACFAKKKGSN